MAAELPEEEKRGVPSYMVSFGDMITLLLTFFILLVALADTQEAGLVAAGKGPIVRHIMSEGKPGMMSGRLHSTRLPHKRDTWWIPSQTGDPDQLEMVLDKLEQEIPTVFKPNEATIGYDRNQLVMRMPSRITFVDGQPGGLDEASRSVLDVIAQALVGHPERRVRISGDVPVMDTMAIELAESARNGRLVYQYLLHRHGVQPHQMSLWGWGATRPRLPSNRADDRNRALTLEVIDTSPDGVDTGARGN